jgi:hypothetical protein
MLKLSSKWKLRNGTILGDTHVVLGTDRTVPLLSVMYRTSSTLRTESVKLGMSFVLLQESLCSVQKKKLDFAVLLYRHFVVLLYRHFVVLLYRHFAVLLYRHFAVLLYRHYESRQLFGVACVTACRKTYLDSRQGKEFYFFSKVSRPVLGTSHPLIQCVKGVLSLRAK